MIIEQIFKNIKFLLVDKNPIFVFFTTLFFAVHYSIIV